MLIAGTDIIEVHRVERVAQLYGLRFIQRIYTDQEAAYCQGRAAQLATRFAAKEAVMKALGTGIRGVRWRDIEVVRQKSQAPTIQLHGTALKRAKQLGIEHLAVALSHSEQYAVAFVVADSLRGNLIMSRE